MGYLLRDSINTLRVIPEPAEILVEIKVAAADSSHPAHRPAHRILNRNHFKVAYERKGC